MRAECEYFRMHRIRIRAAGFFGLQCNVDYKDQAFIKEHGGKVSGSMCPSRGRYANFSGTGGLIELGGQNFFITVRRTIHPPAAS